ncbi:unnamed protein product [Linum trigynum]|uniref:Uncharacterized protein n=1 Tax=Linum trigynum TaxID=586398 RepID=A0AAV2ETI9_9ROSI
MARFLGSCTGRPGRLHGRAREQYGRAPYAEDTHGQPLKLARPCERAEVRLNDTLRFELHGQNGDMHGRAPWPCESGFPGFKPNSEPKKRGSWVLDPKHPRDEPKRERAI